MARAVLVTDAPGLVPRVARALASQLGRLTRKDIAAQSLQTNGALVLVGSLEEAAELANRLAPEHLELLVRVPQALLPRVRHAGAIFVGGRTPEVVGDYVAGPSHVLPTAGTARFSSPLGVEDFVKRSSVIEYSSAGLQAALGHLRTLADIEGLGGHRAAADVRAGGEGR
jgi:histidinol dehydrogenase